jgi:16S rRNA (cytosine967-C5)-methyltransferase
MTEPKHAHARYRQALEALGRTLDFTHPADKVLERYFREHKQMGSKDRASCAEAVYGALRHLSLLQHVCRLAGEREDATGITAAWLLMESGWSARALEAAHYAGDAAALATAARTLDRASLPFEVRWSLPIGLAERLQAQYGREAEALVRALDRSAPVDLRVNTVKTTREAVIARLEELGHPALPIEGVPDGVRLAKRAPLFALPEFKQGWFEVQDAGSQRLSLFVAPQRGERILDLCAGAGGKTLHLATLLANSGQVYACDINPKRLNELSPRLARSGLSNVQSHLIDGVDDARLASWRGQFDAVLVDAPCSGTGTLRRNPDIKWRPPDLEELARLQRALLTAATRAVKPDGRVVYATCSVLAQENQAVVADAPAGWRVTRELVLLPQRDDCDGFYAAELKKGSN